MVAAYSPICGAVRLSGDAGRKTMTRESLAVSAIFCLGVIALATVATAQSTTQSVAQPATPAQVFETRKITENVYIFRYQGHQSMFVVTPEGVAATDPIASHRPAAAAAYIAEIRKITQAPIKYVIYSHHHYDHIAGGKPFKELGAVFVAHRNAKARLEVLQNPEVVMPDVAVEDRYDIALGGIKIELHYVGRNHSDNSLVMSVPKDGIIFAVDFIPIESVQFRDMPDGYLPDWFGSLDRVLAMDWDRLIPGHPNAGGRLGTKEDVRNLRTYMTDLMEVTRLAADEGKCNDKAMTEIKLPKYEKWGGYAQYLPGNIERFCYFWNGI
jgi:glyoxylase-like metal-dependent hydrolase (beta-lactamase superfamily II)